MVRSLPLLLVVVMSVWVAGGVVHNHNEDVIYKSFALQLIIATLPTNIYTQTQ